MQAGLLSATIAASLVISFPDLRPDTSTLYLAKIYNVLTEPNISSIPPASAQPPAFSPSAHAIWVNLLWIFSLGMGLTGAVAATMLQQWTRQYLMLTQAPLQNPKRRARIHSKFSRSTDKLVIKSLGYLLPFYLHFSIFLFSIGLLIFLRDIYRAIFSATVGFFVLSMITYTFCTILQFLQRGSLLSTPVSTLPVSFFVLIVCIAATFRYRFSTTVYGFVERWFRYMETMEWILDSDQLPMLDAHILDATFGSLGEDDVVKNFFEAIPDFFPSNPSERLPITAQFEGRFKEVMVKFLDHTFQLTTVTESVKCSRLLICLNASRAATGSKGTSRILSNILSGKWPDLIRSIEVGHSLKSWSDGCDEENAQYVRRIVSRIIASAKKHDDRWLALFADEQVTSKGLLRDYLAQNDSALLANFIEITRQTLRSRSPYWNVSSLLSTCNISRAHPTLQHDFCDLWNDIVQEVQDRNGDRISAFLKDIHHAYVALHNDIGTSAAAFSVSTADHLTLLNQPSSYPSCNIAAHRSHQLPNVSDGLAEDVSHTLVYSSPQAIPLRNHVSVPGTPPSDTPGHHHSSSRADEPSPDIVTNAPQPAISSPVPALLSSQPFLTPSSDITAVDTRQEGTDFFSISSTADLGSHSISSGVAASRQKESESVT